MISADKCRVDTCDRNAAASMVHDNLPRPLPLCATHTEEFRQTGEGWTIVWDHASLDPSSVTIPAAPRIGRTGPPTPDTSPNRPADSGTAGVKSRLMGRWKRP